MTVPYKNTGFFAQIVIDYLAQKPELNPFYNNFNAIDGYKNIIKNKQFDDQNRQILADVLQKQHENLPKNDITNKNIALLRLPNTYTITTGHQLCLAGSPMYFFYKIAGTIALCRTLKKTLPDHNFVPIFWLASEDHDFDEINNFTLFNKKYTWQTAQQGAVGRMNLEGLENIFNNDFWAILGNTPAAESLKNIFTEVYLNSPNLSIATQKLVHIFFGNEGIITLDADCHNLKKIFMPVIKKEITEQFTHDLVVNTTQKLEKLGYKGQVTPRMINFFYIKNSLRSRLVFEDNLYKVLDTDIQFAPAEMAVEIEKYPENFSPNVVLRPVYQEYILPNIAYIGGGGELAYWLQFKGIFDVLKMEFPVLVLRNSVLFINENQRKKRQNLGFTVDELFEPIENLQRKYLATQPETVDLMAETEALNGIFEKIKHKAESADASLAGYMEAEAVRLHKQIEGIEAKLRKAQKQKHDVALNQIAALKQGLFSDNNLQERTEGFIGFYLKYGADFMQNLCVLCDPLLQKDFLVVEG